MPTSGPIRRPPRGSGRWSLAASVPVFAVCFFLALIGLGRAAGKVDTRAFNATFASQSGKMYDHLLKIQDYYASLAKEGDAARVKDALALRASLSACWELFLNGGDMVYIYDQVDANCPETVAKIGDLVHRGLGVIAGKLEKELEWLGLTERNVGDQPVSVELTQARKDILAAVASFRQTAALFAPPGGSGTGQPAAK